MKKTTVRLLSKLERLFKIDIRYVLAGNFWLNTNRFLSIANGLALSISFAHFLTKEDYGIYSYALIVIGLFSTPLTTAMGAGMVKGVPRNNHHIIFEGLRFLLPWSIVASFLLGAIAVYYGYMGNLVLFFTLLLGSLSLPILIRNGMAKSFLSVKGDFGFTTRFNALRTPISTALLVGAALIGRSALPVLITSILTNIVLSYLLYIAVAKKYDLHEKSHNDHGDVPFSKKYALHSAFLSIFNYGADKIDNLILWKFLGASPVAVYSYALAPIRELKSLIENQSTLAIPKFAQKDYSIVLSGLLLRIKQLYIFTIPLIIIYVISAPTIFKYLFPQYLDAVFLSQLASLSLLSSPRKLINVAISSHQKIFESYLINVIPNMIKIILSFIFISKYGINGAVYGLLISEMFDYIILGLIIRRTKK